MPEPNSLGPPWNPGLPGIVDCREKFQGQSRSANLEGVPQYQRVFLVRTNTLKPNLVAVAAAPGLDWREPYPTDPNAVLVDSNTSQDGDNPFHYTVTYVYRFLDETEKIPWLRPSQFSFTGSLTSAPAFWYYKNAGDNAAKEIIVNSAGDPLTGLDRDEAEFNVSITYNQKPPFNYTRAQEYVNAINSDIWSGGAPKTWKCQSITATRKFEVIPAEVPDQPPIKVYYYETSIALAYRNTGWDLETWDVGFNEIVNGERKKILAGDDPVSEPVALSGGVAKAPGLPPDSRTFRIYKTLQFTGVFEPIPDSTRYPSTYPYDTPANYYGW